MRYNVGADSFYIMKLCSRLFVLYCRSCPKDDRSRHFDPNFEEVRGGVEPWSMARWKARAEFLLSVFELLFLSPTVESLQNKMCQNSLPSGVGRSLWAKISGERGRPCGIFFGFYKTRHILLSNGANCTVLRAVLLTQYRRLTDGQTDRQTDGQTDRRTVEQTDGRNCCSLYSACNASIARAVKSRQQSPSGHHPTTLSRYTFATKAHIDNRKQGHHPLTGQRAPPISGGT